MLMLIFILIILVALSSSSCDLFKQKKHPSKPEPVSPIPLQIGNKWIYNTYLVFEIESQYSIDNKPAWRVAYYFSTVPDTRIYYIWQWDADNNLFKEYNQYSAPVACFEYPGQINNSIEWGLYRTTLIETGITENYFINCHKYKIESLSDSTKIYHSTIKDGIGFVYKSDGGNLESYVLN